MNTLVTFKSSQFNQTQSKGYYLNPTCFGDDVCLWLMEKLREQNIEVASKPEQEDFGWYFNFNLPEGKYCFVVGYQAGDLAGTGLWIGWIERECGWLASLFGGRKKNIPLKMTEIIHEALINNPEIQEVRWYTQENFDRGLENQGMLRP